MRIQGEILKSKEKRSRFWGSLAKVCRESVRRRPPFSGGWLSEIERDDEPLDARGNVYLKTEVYPETPENGPLYRLEPFEYTADREVTNLLSGAMERSSAIDPPGPVLENEKALRRFSEKSFSRIITRKGGSEGVPEGVLSRICAQYTTGYGPLEHLFRDGRVQDIYVDSPSETNPVYVTLGGTDPDLEGTYPTNLYLSEDEVRRIVTILSYHSDRPFSEANPVLECDLDLFNSRATVVGPPMSPTGISLAFRKHSHDPWTLIRLISAGSLDPYSAAFLNLAIDGRSTLLVAGPRGAGKTSLLGALLFEVERSQRIIVIEDTPELPTVHLNENGYKSLPLLIGEGSKTASDALRTALRLGESVIVMGEVRGPETRVLYEAMSAGTAGSSVMGTFHAESARSVYKRVVDDMGVPAGSFGATDLVVVCGLVRPGGGKRRKRRVVQVSEVVKGESGEFRDLMMYDAQKDRLRRTKEWKRSDTIKRISRTWGWDTKKLLGELDARASVFRKAVKTLPGDKIIRPETEARLLECYRSVRSRALEEGWLGDVERVVEVWETDFTGGWDA